MASFHDTVAGWAGKSSVHHRNQLQEQQDELNGKKEALHSLSMIRDIAKFLNGDVLSISQRIDMFSEIWTMVSAT